MSRLRILTAAFMFVGLSCLATPAAAKIFLIHGASGKEYGIYEVDSVAGEVTWLGPLPDDQNWLSLAVAGDSELYAASTNRKLFRITLNPFKATLIDDTIPRLVVGMASDGGDLLYMINHTTDTIFEYELSTGTGISLGTLSLPDLSTLDIDGGDLDRDTNGQWYIWTRGNQVLTKIDLVGMTATPLGRGPENLGFVGGLVVDRGSGDKIIGISEHRDALVEYDPATGAAVALQTLCESDQCPTVFDVEWTDMASLSCPDADGDGFSPRGGACGPADCNDQDTAFNPGRTEICNGVDENCDGEPDELCIMGSGSPKNNCFIEWTVKNPNNIRGQTFRAQWCQDGDPTCDMDSIAGQCTFEVTLCANVPDPRISDRCTPQPIHRLSIGTPSRGLAEPIADTLQSEVMASWPGAVDAGMKNQAKLVDFSPVLTQNLCTNPFEVVVEARSRQRIPLIAFHSGERRNRLDKDIIYLRCLPASRR